MEGYEVKKDINGLGMRLNDLALKQADCSGRTSERLLQMDESNRRRDVDITKIFQAQERMNVSLAEVKNTIKTWGVVVGFASPLVAAIVAAIIGRVL